jgi:hypothetical protein
LPWHDKFKGEILKTGLKISVTFKDHGFRTVGVKYIDLVCGGLMVGAGGLLFQDIR